MPKLASIQKVLVIGSGPVVIGQAAEFDYAGTQACLALKEEGVKVILVNNNPATIMTDPKIADQIYLEPLTVKSLSQIIEKERPDGLLPTLGGQTGLNLAVSLSEAGVLAKYNVELLGTPLSTIQKGEDREKFKELMKEINQPIPESISTNSLDDAIQFANEVGYPIIVRPAYTLGGAGGGIAMTEEELITIAKGGMTASPINQILVEQSVKGWKEIEYEVMRDANDTCIIVCNMENIDPVGIHTGDSIVVAPSQTLSDRQYQLLRTVSCEVIRELGVIGGCNIQFALHPDSDEYVIIEVNPRVSRSSALASKATGYPIARIAAKLALGFNLDEIPNPITQNQFASFEPTLDYVAVKIPRFAFDKFPTANRKLGTQMMATGEVMALARNFPQALQKAMRSLEVGIDGLNHPRLYQLTNLELKQFISDATDERLFAIGEALRRGFSVDELYAISGITKYFLYEIQTLIEFEKNLKLLGWRGITREELVTAKVLGFTNNSLASYLNQDITTIHNKLKELDILPSYKMVDTCAGEFVAKTPYYYSTWNEYNEVDSLTYNKKMVVIGSGPIRMGQGIEFDYCSVHAAFSLKGQKINTVVINNNPETVSTDINVADHLYFEPLTAEDVIQIINMEKADGVLLQFGGQTAINLAKELNQKGIKIMGTAIEAIEATENREKFYQLLQELKIPHIPGESVSTLDDLQNVIKTLGFPILIRPSYVIGGKGMVIIKDDKELHHYLLHVTQQTNHSNLFPLLVDRYIPGYEVEVDVVCDHENILIPGIFQHVERAGIHSGDSIAIFPAPNVTENEKKWITEYAQKVSKALGIKGMMNIQFVISEDRKTIYVLEVNPRASRTVPIASKVTGVPLIDLATRVQMGERLNTLGWNLGLHKPIPFYAVKMPIFSTNKLNGVDPLLGPEMKSTGEAIGIGSTVKAALAKAFGWQEFKRETQNIKAAFLSITEGELDQIEAIMEELTLLGYQVYTTSNNYEFMGKGNTMVHSISIEDAKILCLKNHFRFIYTSQETENNHHFKVFREKALLSNTPCFSTVDSVLAYLKSLQEILEYPTPINTLLTNIGDLNKQKEYVIK